MTNTDGLTSNLQVARVFDGYDREGYGHFAADHTQVADPVQKTRLLDYLNAGEVIMAIRARSHDQLDPSRGPVVPMVFLTDGTWVWSQASAYYLNTYNLLPDLNLVDHIAAHHYQCPPVSEPDAARIFDEFQRIRAHQPIDDQPWAGPARG